MSRPDRGSGLLPLRPDDEEECDQIRGVVQSTIRRSGSIHISAAPGDGLDFVGVGGCKPTLCITQWLQGRRDVVTPLFEQGQCLGATQRGKIVGIQQRCLFRLFRLRQRAFLGQRI